MTQSADEAPEFETFEITKAAKLRKFAFLKRMPKGAHFHFPDPPNVTTFRQRIADLNNHLAKDGIHFGAYRVGDEDPKGPGFRVLRDDKPINRRQKVSP